MKNLVLMSVFVAAPAAAQPKSAWNPEISSVPVTDCTTQAVTTRMEMQGISGAADVANGQLPMLKEFESINNKAKDNGRPVGEQLSKGDLVRFAELSQKLKVGTLGGYVESRRQRDAKVLQRMVELADQEFRFSRQDAGSDRDAVLSGVLLAMREFVREQKNWPRPNSTATAAICSFSLAAGKLAEEGFEKLRASDTSTDTAALERIKARYNVRPIDPEKLSSEDRTEFYRIRRNLAAPLAAYAYVTDMQNLVWLSEAMDMNYRAMKQDVIAGGGDIAQIGKTVDRMEVSGEISPQQAMGFRVLKIINDKIPADVVSDWSKTGTPTK